MLVKMNVVGRENFTVNTLTGEVSGKTYHSREFLKDNFDAKWDASNKRWTVDVEKFNSELAKYADYYKKYIDEIVETPEDQVVESTDQAESEALETASVKPDKVIVSKELINKWDGFYNRVTYSDRTIRDYFVG